MKKIFHEKFTLQLGLSQICMIFPNPRKEPEYFETGAIPIEISVII